MSGFELAQGADLLIHDGQYTSEEYAEYVGYGHSSVDHMLAFAKIANVRHLVPFHHDPSHTDEFLDRLYDDIRKQNDLPFDLSPGAEGRSFTIGSHDEPPTAR